MPPCAGSAAAGLAAAAATAACRGFVHPSAFFCSHPWPQGLDKYENEDLIKYSLPHVSRYAGCMRWWCSTHFLPGCCRSCLALPGWHVATALKAGASHCLSLLDTGCLVPRGQPVFCPRLPAPAGGCACSSCAAASGAFSALHVAWNMCQSAQLKLDSCGRVSACRYCCLPAL